MQPHANRILNKASVCFLRDTSAFNPHTKVTVIKVELSWFYLIFALKLLRSACCDKIQTFFFLRGNKALVALRLVNTTQDTRGLSCPVFESQPVTEILA
ncbi:hypothetical protein PoB_004411500 [Plakobranchus ocellatus]|uniref:Uncharacterized protein n=1 Tax=Plakobranchus ocellatus TaxID=259542 RepID=A0AAV4BEQ5_9GAST|nr:hypothetical protein PoB_004411500 [Plakobranchus ocellatus]